MFTKEELNAIAIMVSNAPISGKDAKFIAALLDKIAGLLDAEKADPSPTTPS